MALTRGQILVNPEIVSGVAADGASVILLEGSNNGTNTVTIKAPDSLTANYILTLPVDDGTANQVLQTDGNGILSWTTPAGLTAAGSNGQIQYNSSGSFAGASGITTDGSNLLIASQGDLRLGDGTNWLGFQAPASIGADRTYTLPATIGSAGDQLLIASSPAPTATSATLVWGTASGTTQSAAGAAGDVQISNGAGTFTFNTNLNFDTANTRLNIGNKTAAAGNLFVEGTFFEPVKIKITEDSATFGPNIGLYRQSASPAGSDGLGYIWYYGAYSISTPPSTQQNYTYGLFGYSIVDPVQDSTGSGSYGPFGKINLYLANRDSGSAVLSRTVDFSPNFHRHVVNWPTTGTYTGYQFEVTTSQGGGTNNITPNAASSLFAYFYQGSNKCELGIDGVLTNFGLDLVDSDASNFVGLRAPTSVTSNYNITFPAAGGAANEILQFDASQNASFVSNTRTLNFVIDGGGSAITTGKKGVIVVDGDYTVTGWTVIADQSGSIVVDVNRATYTNFPTTASIAGSELPTLSSAQKNEDLTLTTWTTTLSARDVLEFEVDSVATVTRVTVALRLVPR